ncbi:MAG TPA: hypothetical protein VGI19_16220 [Candidatus Cybelea sp.]|jgi:hypothetical protein
MIRSLVVVGAIGLALIPSVAALGAPTPANVPGHHGGAVPHPELGRGAQQNAFKVPEIDVKPRSLGPNIQTPYQRHLSESSRNYVLYQPPPWYQSQCFAPNLFPTVKPSDSYVPPGTTIGDLVDSHSKNLFSSKPSYNPGLPLNQTAQAAPDPSSIQFQASQCSPYSSFTF